MIEENDVPTEPDLEAIGDTAESEAPVEPRKRMPPVESRFMFVDIAALRAKQLRRGALPRVTLPRPDIEHDAPEPSPKLERIAMQEVEDGLIVYDFPSMDSTDDSASAEKTS